MEFTTHGDVGAPEAAPYVAAHETHSGVVILAGDRAYKAKKPVQTDFLDFRTVEQREEACAREVRLNSRIAPDSYFGVAHLSGPSAGAPEPIVVMRRYQDDQRLASMVSNGAPVEGVLDSIARTLADFHDRAERGPRISLQGKPEAIHQRWFDNFPTLRRHADTVVPGETVRLVEDLAGAYLAGRADLFAQRIDAGCIVDGHADLLADDIFWAENRPVLLDCLEFSDDLRFVDRIDDAAFLAMDLEFLGRKDLGDHFLNRYATYTGDAAPSSLRDFYIAYRALVRAKVDCVQLSQGKSGADAAAARHLDIAASHLERGAIRLVLVGGGPGTGKSTLARKLAERVGAVVVSTDDVRKELHESGQLSGAAGSLGAGLYAPANVAAVYQAVLHRAGRNLAGGQSVILDGTWRDAQVRAEARRVAADKHAASMEIQCVVPVDVAADRIRSRAPGNSDATPQIAEALAAHDFEWDTAHRVDTSQPLDDCVRKAQELWRAAIQRTRLP
ncbi:bifunctional aminoglycoside phosphotransferase/ATP-binding protein [Mycobacterium sp. UM_WGJ]|uniref:bifunctional aminoglycoside phosphotransferase/ATP-binding protein n=1 Tax=Mycobacterium sp. UM_WGJ TaxID=1370120 RepID=UPI0004052986|nr:bifunctional aminoglycoside phosphotransferase/ATP-binding protein [Mycobacterium sp. UM_WGJ]